MNKKIELIKKTGLALGSVLALAFAPIIIIILVISVAVYLELKN